MLGGNQNRRAEAEREEIALLHVALIVVHFVHDEQNLFSETAQARRNFVVERRAALRNIRHQYDELRRLNCKRNLLFHRIGNDFRRRLFREKPDPARIHQQIIIYGNAFRNQISRYARHIVHDRNTPPDEAVKKAAFSDIRAPHDGDAPRYLILLCHKKSFVPVNVSNSAPQVDCENTGTVEHVPPCFF